MSLEETIVKSAYAPTSTLVIKNRKWMFSSYPNSFVGSEFLSWLVSDKFNDTNDEAQKLANKMLTEGHIKSFANEKTLIPTNYYAFRNLRVLVIGTGGAGFPAALELQKEGHCDVTVITKDKDYWYIPSIPFSFASNGYVWKKTFESVFKSVKVVINQVVSFEPNLVTCVDGTKFDQFDYLIVGTGSYYADVPCKDPNVLVIKANLPEMVESNKDAIRKAKNIVVVGSGTVGCEIFAPICEFNPEIKCTMVSSSKTVIARRIESIQKPILTHLKGLKNAELKFGQRVSEISDGKVKTDKEEIQADVVFLATGFRPYTQVCEKTMPEVLDNGGYVKTNEFLQLEKHPHVFVCGDIVASSEEKLGQVAEEHAKLTVHNIMTLMERKPLKKYVPGPRGYSVYLGSSGSLAMGDTQMWYGKMVSTTKYYLYSKLFGSLV